MHIVILARNCANVVASYHWNKFVITCIAVQHTGYTLVVKLGSDNTLTGKYKNCSLSDNTLTLYYVIKIQLTTLWQQ